MAAVAGTTPRAADTALMNVDPDAWQRLGEVLGPLHVEQLRVTTYTKQESRVCILLHLRDDTGCRLGLHTQV